MKALAYLLGACVILAVVKAVMAAVALLVALAIVIGAITRPREMLSLAALVVFVILIENHPVMFLSTIALLAVASIVTSGRR
ncbi:hypothetical protein [Sphingomonas sp. IC4-52]|uniref:hypothetical protein n=1 Tax=Sphingomonas sp. IC4-52 TaxID=2887202 RepID=UPI001D101553|nr:hypothetical protein [Sphingomonas sp. IC4-52]MCC2980048.1 hypothetical protein [Sphingomonas sp. IC4-52]